MLYLTFTRIPAEFMFALGLAIVFSVQLFISLRVGNVFVRLLPSILLFISTAALLVHTYTTDGGWDAVGYLLLALLSGALLASCLLALIVGGIVRLIRKA